MRGYKLINGNLLDAQQVDYICHQVNCQGKMGSGVAKAIRDKHDNVYYRYINHINECKEKGINPLGTIQLVVTNPDKDSWDAMCGTPYHGIINMFAQDRYGYDGKQYTDLDAFKTCLNQINTMCENEIVAFPWLIGCCRGGADWNVVLPMILETLTNVREIKFYKL